MKKQATFMAIVLIFAILLCGAVSATETYDIGTNAAKMANNDPGITNTTNPNDALVITTAGSAKFKGKTTEDSLQGIVDTTSAITPGNGNLVTLNDPNGALEFTFVKKSGTTLIAKKYTSVSSGTEYNFNISNSVIISAADITNWEYVKQQLGPKGFGIVSIANAWANGAPKDLLKIAGYSGGVSEGLISSYAMAQNFVKNYPLTENDQSYHVLVSPGGGDDNVPMFLMDDTPLKWSTTGSNKYYNFYGMSNGNLNDNVYIWWDSGTLAGNLAFWTLNENLKNQFGTVLSGTLSEIKFNNWLLSKLGTDASSLVHIEKNTVINKANFDYLWANGIDKNYIMKLGGAAPIWNAYTNVLPENNYSNMFNAGKNAADKANAAFASQGLGTLNTDDLVITSAGYSQVNGLSFGALDGIISATFTKLKLENLFSLKRGSQTPLWFVFVKKPTNTDGPLYAVFVDALGNVVPVNYNSAVYNVFDISSANLAGSSGSEGWAKSSAVFNAYTYNKPSYAQQDFYIVSLANLWAAGMPYDFLRPACDGGCPGSGLSMGYVITDYIRSVLPIGPNEYYMYIGIPAHCKEQAIMEGLGISPAQGTYFTPGSQTSPSDTNSVGIAIKWNSITNTGTAMLIDFNKAVLNPIQPQNSNWYKTMYWGMWYLQHGFPGTDLYGQVLAGYSIATKSDGITPAIITITQQDFNTLVAAGGDPVKFIKNFVSPVNPNTPTPNSGYQGTGIISGIPAIIDQTFASITKTSSVTQQTAAPAEIASGLPLGDNTTKNSNSEIPVLPVASAILAVILVLLYLGKNSVISAIKRSERPGK